MEAHLKPEEDGGALEAVAQVPRHSQVREQCILLKDEPHAAKVWGEVNACGCVEERAPIQPDEATTRTAKTDQAEQGETLARSRWAIERGDVTAGGEGRGQVKAIKPVLEGELEHQRRTRGSRLRRKRRTVTMAMVVRGKALAWAKSLACTAS
jgi:hypothetical protein